MSERLTVSGIIYIIPDMKSILTVQDIDEKILRLKHQLLKLGSLHPGSLSRQYQVCGKRGCKCMDPQKPRPHGPYSKLTYVYHGKFTCRDVKKVTIALGMLAGGNVVIAADTQIGIPEYLNARGNKVAWASRSSEGEQDAAMAITGAGNTHCVDHLKNEFTGAFTMDWDAVSNTKNFKEYAAGHLNEF